MASVHIRPERFVYPSRSSAYHMGGPLLPGEVANLKDGPLGRVNAAFTPLGTSGHATGSPLGAFIPESMDRVIYGRLGPQVALQPTYDRRCLDAGFWMTWRVFQTIAMSDSGTYTALAKTISPDELVAKLLNFLKGLGRGKSNSGDVREDRNDVRIVVPGSEVPGSLPCEVLHSFGSFGYRIFPSSLAKFKYLRLLPFTPNGGRRDGRRAYHTAQVRCQGNSHGSAKG